MPIRDALLAYAHYITIFALASLLLAELAIFRKALPGDLYRRLRLIDRWYGIMAGLVIVTGLLRLNFGLKGAQFYVHNPLFWTKMAVIVALLSIAPTIAFIKWNARKAADGSIVVDDADAARIRGFLLAQVAVFVFIPLCATFMARGL